MISVHFFWKYTNRKDKGIKIHIVYEPYYMLQISKSTTTKNTNEVGSVLCITLTIEVNIQLFTL